MVDRSQGASDIRNVPTIRDLIRTAIDAGRSVRQLEEDSGYQVKFQTFQDLSANPPKQFPKESKTIAGMAQALGVTPTTVVLAYAQSLGIPVETRSTFALRLPPGADQLDVDMQNALIGVVRAAVRSRARDVGIMDKAKEDSVASLLGSAAKDSRDVGLNDRKKRNQG